MASFSIYDYGPDWIGVDVPLRTGYTWYRIYVRDNVYPYTVMYDEWHYHNDDFVSLQVVVDGLEPETEYAVNVAHSTSYNGSDAQMGTAQYVTTLPATGGGGTGETVRIDLDWDTNVIYSIRAYWVDEYGEEQGERFYEPTWIEVQQETYIEITSVRMADGYEDSFPVFAQDEYGYICEVLDENGELNESYLPVEYWDNTFTFYTGAGGSTGEIVRVDIDWDSRYIYAVGMRYIDEYGTEQDAGSTSPFSFNAQVGTTMEVTNIQLQDGYDYPGYCEDPFGTVYTVRDADGDWTEDKFPVVEGGGTYRFYLEDQGEEGGDGSWVQRRVYFDWLEYDTWVSDGEYWWLCETYVAQ